MNDGFLVYYLFDGHDSCSGSFEPVAVFVGEDAEEKAKAKVVECRKRVKVSNYYYKRVMIE